MRIAALSTYLVSFALPALDGMLGIQLFVLAYYHMLLGLLHFAPSMMVWLANPLFWYGYAALRRGNGGKAALCGLAATIIALSVLWLMGRELQGALGWGFYLWLGSMVMLTLAGLSRTTTYRGPSNSDDSAPEAFPPGKFADGGERHPLIAVHEGTPCMN